MSEGHQVEALHSLAEARSQTYAFLSQLFLEPPTPKLVDQLRETGFVDGLAKVFGTSLGQSLAEFAQGFQGDYEAIVQEYHDLFLVPLNAYVPPYEAVYRDEREIGGRRVKGFIMGESTLAVQRSYQEAGVEISPEFTNLPDHVGLELAFMHLLCEREREAWRKGELGEALASLRRQKQFLQKHLGQWAPALCARIERNAQGPFYKVMAQFTEAFLLSDEETLRDTLPD